MGFKVAVAKNGLHFAASHFITYGGKCEFLHGHNYAVAVELEGPLTEDGFVYDFVALKKMARRLCDSLDHRFLMPTRNPHLRIQRCGQQWEIVFKDAQYLLPEKDVKPLPLDNITAERLAEYLWEQIAQEIGSQGEHHLERLTVSVEEAEGQAAYYSNVMG